MEHIIHSQVMQHLDTHKILCDQQHGFRKRRSCDSQLLVTIQDISANLDEGEQIDAILLDFSKAFDKVPTNAYYRSYGTMVSESQPYNGSRVFFQTGASKYLLKARHQIIPRHLRYSTRHGSRTTAIPPLH